mgnify:CR=1 FL=1
MVDRQSKAWKGLGENNVTIMFIDGMSIDGESIKKQWRFLTYGISIKILGAA